MKTNATRPRTRLALVAIIAALCSAGCGHTAADANNPASKAPTATAAASNNVAAALELNGTYNWTLTMDGVPKTFTVRLEQDKWSMSETGSSDTGSGSYVVNDNKIAFTWPRAGAVLTFTYLVDSSGSVHLTPVLPMDPGDQFVWSSKPWVKAG